MRRRSLFADLVERICSRPCASRQSIREDFFPQLYVCQLEQRRVLTVNVDAGGDQTDVDEGEGVALDSATFSDPIISDQAISHTAEIDWGDGIIEAGTVDELFGTIAGSHVYADNGVYTVVVSVTNTQGDSGQDTLTVTVDNVAPSLTAAEDQTIDEGELLSITDIGVFTDPGFDNPLNTGGELTESFVFSIDWGDGTGASFGVPTIDTPGGPDVPTAGSFDGSHIYADNGIYTVTVTVFDDDGGMATDTLAVTVNNVAPSLIAPGDQFLFQNELLDLPDIGTFIDPGFDNPLNVGGELVETFVFSVDWGDDTPADFGVTAIDTPGGPGVLTAGSFDGSHSFAAGGTFTVTVTVFDDDGGSDSATFEVFVIPITVPPVGAMPPPGGALADQTLPELVITPESPRTFAEQTGTSDFRLGRAVASPVAEKRYVLRVVSPVGKESDDAPLKDDVLDHLQELYAKLPDDHYRIYLIRADGTERFVLDFHIHNGKRINPTDAADQLRDLPSQPAAAPGAPAEPAPADENNHDNGDRQSSAPPPALPHNIQHATAPVEWSADGHERATVDPKSLATPFDTRPRHALTIGTSIGVTAAAIAYARGTPWRRRVDRAMQQPSSRRLTKAARLCRHVRHTGGQKE